MLAAQVVSHAGPGGLRIGDSPEPTKVPELIAAFGPPVRIGVRAAGVSFPELLQSRGEYQLKPELPFVLGSEVAGIVEEAPRGSGFAAGDRVFAFSLFGGFAERALAPAQLTFPLSERLDFGQGAAIFANYQTAYFALRTRGRSQPGERVLVHGAAGGVGTATLQVAAALGLETVAIVSSEEKEKVAARAGADLVLRSDRPWKDELLEQGGVDIVIDTVGDRALDSLRALREAGRLVIVGFAAGEIPSIKANRLLLRNLEVIGAGCGAFVFPRPALSAEISARLAAMIEAGSVQPIVGARFGLEQAGAALSHLESRRAVGKVVLEIGSGC